MEEAINRYNALNQVLENLGFTSKVYICEERVRSWGFSSKTGWYSGSKPAQLIFKTDIYDINNFIGVRYGNQYEKLGSYYYFELYADYVGGEIGRRYTDTITKEFMDTTFADNKKKQLAKVDNEFEKALEKYMKFKDLSRPISAIKKQMAAIKKDVENSYKSILTTDTIIPVKDLTNIVTEFLV